ncbi:excisionase family DNA-binding protein [Paraburkholderia phenoliruptrix]|uniref:excisionase family DNA-binding protein n=1 Tax=Paraburkholderia phenoliruptrix TaxID=252970 RepID=UPI002869B0FA|nr:excisionase family DNA-binding protein [Paraburkholderia phenoliruptrix]WMY09082.1 excisionase family DNA-binding protein [Paraburkholderia phenoliruptrix]
MAALLVDPIGWNALLEQLSDVQLGRMFKNRLWKVIGVSTILNIDLPSMRDEGEKLRKSVSRKSKLRKDENDDLIQRTSANSERYDLVRQGKLLRMDDYLGAADVTEKKLSKSLASGKVFSVELDGGVYIPGFFLSPMINHNDFAKAIRGLGAASGWDRWDFFTTPTEALGDSTPLQFLAINKVKPVLKAADEVAKSRQADANDFMSTGEAAKLLFVSRRHVVKLLEQGQLKLHHKTGNNRFVTKASVLNFQVNQRAAVKRYHASTADEK